MLRRLLVLRHAKSSWDDPLLDDHDRPLAKRGRKATKKLRRYLDDQDLPIEVVLCSTALRAVQTVDGIRDALAPSVRVSFEDDLYGARPGDLLSRLRRVPDDVGVVMLVGHNPALEELVRSLVGGGDMEAIARLQVKYPTGALAQLRVSGGWDELGPGRCELESFVLPRELS